MWEDEWLLSVRALGQHSIADAIFSTRFDGHPPAWSVLIYFLTRVTTDPAAIKTLHVLIASTTIFLIWRFGPFTLLEKILLPLGYFLLFEYSTITRGYAAGVLLAVIAAIGFTSARRHPLRIWILLLLLGQFSLYSMILSLAIAAGLLANSVPERRSARSWLIPACILLSSLALFYIATRPAASAQLGQQMNISSALHPERAAAAMFDAFSPLPQLQLHWWNTQLIAWPEWLRGLLGLLVIAIAARTLRTRQSRIIFIFGCAAVFAVVLFIYTGYLRHWGHVFILFLIATWIDRRLRSNAPTRFARTVFLAIISIQAIAGITAAALHARYPFTSARQAAQFIRQTAPDLPIAGDFDYVLVSLAGELNKPIWYIRANRYAWAIPFDSDRRRNVSLAMIQDQVRDLAKRENSDVLLVMTYTVPLSKEFEPIAHIPPGTVQQEEFFIYRYRLSSVGR